MTRDQAQAILDNIDLIRHFAEGGDIGHRMFNCHGKQVAIYPAHAILLSNMRPGKLTTLVKVKAKYRMKNGVPERVIRWGLEHIKESEIIP